MANDIVNVIHVTRDIEEFKKAVLNEEGKVDFEKVVSMPKELLIKSGSMSYDQNLTLNSDGTCSCSTDLIQLKIQLILENFYKEDKSQEQYVQEVLDETIDNPYWDKEEISTCEEVLRDTIKCKAQGYWNFEQYGFKDWYDWSRVKWGTKWNAYGEGDEIRENENGLFIEFMTANSIPLGVFEELGKKFNFTVAFANRDNTGRNVGIVKAENNECKVMWFDDLTEYYSDDDCMFLADKICDVGYEDDEERKYVVSLERMEELNRMIEPYLM